MANTPFVNPSNMEQANNEEDFEEEKGLSFTNEYPRACLSRWCGKMGPGSVRGSMLALTATAIGGGVLSLPYVCQLSGAILGAILLILGYIATVWSFTMIIRADEKTGGHAKMKEFLERCGSKGLSRAYDIIVIFFLYGALLGYQVIIASLVQGVMGNLKLIDNPKDIRIYQIVFTSVFIVFPLCLMKTVNSLRYPALLTIFAIVYTAVLLIVELPFYWGRKDLQGELVLFKIDWGIFNAFGITFWSFTAQTSFYSSFEELTKDKKDTPHKYKITYRSLTINLVVFLLMTMAGYLSTFSNTPDLIINRKSAFEGTDYAMLITQILIPCGLCISTSINFVPLRTSVLNQIYGEANYTLTRAFIGSLLFASTTCVLTIFVPTITTVISIFGGIGCSAICFLIPIICFLSVFPENKIEGYISIFIGSILVAIGGGAVLNAIYIAIG